MSSQYKENKFSTENLSVSYARYQDGIDKPARPNIDHLIKRILVERRRGKKNSIILGTIFLSIILFFYFFQY